MRARRSIACLGSWPHGTAGDTRADKPRKEYAMLIVDAQVHIWGKGIPTNPAHRQISSFTQDDLLQEMDAAGVNAAVIHPPGWIPILMSWRSKPLASTPTGS